MRTAGIEHILRADDIRRMIAVVGTPCAGFRGVVEHRIETLRERGHHRIAIGEVALQLANAERIEHGIMTAIEARDLVPAFDQAAAQRLAQESATSGNQYPHGASSRACRDAQAASFSRPILALWRISTGNGFG